MAVELVNELRKVPALEGLAPALAGELAALATSRNLEAGATIVEQDQVFEGLFLVVSGSAQLLRRLPTGETRVLDTLFDGTVFGQDSLFGAEASPHLIRAGDGIALAAPNNRFLHAEGGGGGALRANRETAGGWETFTLLFDDSGDDR